MAERRKQCIELMTTFFKMMEDAERRFQTEILDPIEEHRRRTRNLRRRQRRKKKKSVEVQNASDELSTAGENLDGLVRKSRRIAAKRATELTCQQLNQSLNTKLRNPGPGLNDKMSDINEEPEYSSPSLRECVVLVTRCSSQIFNKKVDVKEKTAENCYKNSFTTQPSSSLSNRVESPVKIANEVNENDVKDGSDLEENMSDSKPPVDQEISPIPKMKTKSVAPILKVSVLSSVVPPKSSIKPKKDEEMLSTESDQAVEKLNEPSSADISDGSCVEFKLPPMTRPCRKRTTNKKYDSKDFVSTGLVRGQSLKTQEEIPNPVLAPAIVITKPSLINLSNTSSTSLKRKSDSDSGGGDRQKIIKLLDEDKKCGPKETSVKEAKGSSESQNTSVDMEQSASKITNHFSVPEPSANIAQEVHVSNNDSSASVVPELVMPKPVMRMTRTRTKEIEKKQALPEQQANMKIANNSNNEKENQKIILMSRSHLSKKNKSPLRNMTQAFSPMHKNKKVLGAPSTVEKKFKSPLKNNNHIFSPSMKSSAHKWTVLNKKNDGSAGSNIRIQNKEDDASTKKMNLLKASREDTKRKRKEKEQRQQHTKMMIEQREQERLERIKREQMEKELQVERARKLKEEQILLKKVNAEAAMKEAEERRVKEEQAKQARLKKQEEEKRQKEEERLKMAEEAKKLHELRLAEQAKEKQHQMNLSSKNAELKAKKLKEVEKEDEYTMSPAKEERLPNKSKNANDYGISDTEPGDSTDDESTPKKSIPKWAQKNNRKKALLTQSYLHPDLINLMFPMYVDLDSLKSSNPRCRNRASSAVWLNTSPPQLSAK